MDDGYGRNHCQGTDLHNRIEEWRHWFCVRPADNLDILKADCSLVGGSPEERLIYAVKLRRLGFSTHSATHNRKRSKMFKAAAAECRWGKGGVYDIDDAEDRAWLDRDDLMERGI